MEEGVWVGGEAGIGEDLVDSVMDNIRWAGKRIYRGNVFSLRPPVVDYSPIHLGRRKCL